MVRNVGGKRRTWCGYRRSIMNKKTEVILLRFFYSADNEVLIKKIGRGSISYFKVAYFVGILITSGRNYFLKVTYDK